MICFFVVVCCRYLSDLGYAISSISFRGPFISKKQIAAGGVHLAGITLYCVQTKSSAMALALPATDA
jgi:hypothetical protein